MDIVREGIALVELDSRSPFGGFAGIGLGTVLVGGSRLAVVGNRLVGRLHRRNEQQVVPAAHRQSKRVVRLVWTWSLWMRWYSKVFGDEDAKAISLSRSGGRCHSWWKG